MSYTIPEKRIMTDLEIAFERGLYAGWCGRNESYNPYNVDKGIKMDKEVKTCYKEWLRGNEKGFSEYRAKLEVKVKGGV